jgi:hypothetical protein
MLAFIQCINGWYSPQYIHQYYQHISCKYKIWNSPISNTLYKSHHIPTVLGFLPYASSKWRTYIKFVASLCDTEFVPTLLANLIARCDVMDPMLTHSFGIKGGGKDFPKSQSKLGRSDTKPWALWWWQHTATERSNAVGNLGKHEALLHCVAVTV